MIHESCDLLRRFSTAWNDHDLDTLIACMTADAVFRTAGGTVPHGDVHVGHAALREAFAAIFTRFPDARWDDAVHTVAGDVALTEWTFSGTDTDGNAVSAGGCDVFRLRDGLIAVKDTFRKQVPANSKGGKVA